VDGEGSNMMSPADDDVKPMEVVVETENLISTEATQQDHTPEEPL
jgi:hypothetical protein